MTKLKEMKYHKGLREQALVPHPFSHVSSIEGRSELHVVFHNTRSLHKHIEDLRFENHLLRADILFMFETWEHEHDGIDHYKLQSFGIIHRNSANASVHRQHCGTIVYACDDLKDSGFATEGKRQNKIEITIIDMSSKIKGLIMIGVYSHPKVSAKLLAEQMSNVMGELAKEHTHFLIGGDFNNDASENLAEPLQQFCEIFGLRQLIQSVTTDTNSKLDLVFTNIPNSCISSFVLESWYSDHKPCWVSLAQNL